MEHTWVLLVKRGESKQLVLCGVGLAPGSTCRVSGCDSAQDTVVRGKIMSGFQQQHSMLLDVPPTFITQPFSVFSSRHLWSCIFFF